MQKTISPRPEGLPSDLGAPHLPGSKSHAQRALLLASFLPGPTRLEGLPDNADLAVMRAAMGALGVVVHGDAAGLTVSGLPPQQGQRVEIDAGENATAARMLLAMLPLLGIEVRVDGRASLRRRPMAAAVAMLREAGVTVEGERLPIRAKALARERLPACIRVDANVTTQPASGAMLAVALAGGGMVEVLAPTARGYVELTAQVLRAFGSRVDAEASSSRVRYTIGPIAAAERVHRVPIDPSARTFVLALAALHGRTPPAALTQQAGDAHPEWLVDGDFAELLAAGDRDVTFTGLRQRPDCVPALAVVAASRPGRTMFRRLENLRTKESDRLVALADALRAFGVETAVAAGDLTVRGPLRGAAARLDVEAVADHRIVMALALLGTVLPRGVAVDHADAVAKSWPGYWDWLGRCAVVS